MSNKNYTDEFRRDAVALYRDTDGATIAGIATDLGISHGSLTAWLKKAGCPDPETPNKSGARAHQAGDSRARSRPPAGRARPGQSREGQARDRA